MPKHTYTGLIALINQVITVDNAHVNLALIGFLDGLKGLPLAPASGALRYHHAYEGGLIDHIVDVFTISRDLGATRTQGSPVPALSPVDLLLVSVLHDIHKAQDSTGTPYYQPNILKSGKRSEAEPFEHNDGYLKVACSTTASGAGGREVDFLYKEAVDKVPGGIKSLALVYALAPGLYVLLSEDVKFAIRYHDGVYAHSKFELGGKETPLMIIIHAADLLSSRLNRVKH